MKLSNYIVSLFTLFIIATSCNNKNGTTIQFSTTSDSILNDTTPYNVVYDSIKKAFFASNNDSAKLKLLIELSGKNKKVTFPLIEDAIAHCKKTGNNYALTEAYCEKANYYIRKSEYDTALLYLDDAKRLLEKLNSGKLSAKINFFLGEFYYQQDDNAKAIEYYENSLKIAQGIQDYKLTAYALSGIAESCRMLDKNDKSFEYFKRALKITEKIGDKSRTAFCLSSIGELYRLQGDNINAINYYDKALLIAESIKDKSLITFCTSSRASLYVITSDFQKAIADYEKTIKIAKEYNGKTRVAFCLRSIGEIYRMQNDYPKSLDYFNQSLLISEEVQDKARMAFCYSSIGEIYRCLSDNKNSLEYLNKALKIGREIDDKSRMGFCYNTIAETYLMIGDTAAKNGETELSSKNYQLAIVTLDSAILLSETIDDKLRISDCLGSKGEVYSRGIKNKNDPNFIKALECFKKSLVIGEEIENYNRVALSLSCLGHIYLQINDAQTAKMYSEKALAMAQKSEIPSNVLSSSIVLYQAYAKTGDYKKAYEMHQLFKKMSDSLTNIDNVKRFAATEYQAKEDKLKLEKTKQEVEFKAEQIKQDAELHKQRTVRNAFILGFLLVAILAFVIFRSLQQNRKAKKIIEEQKAETEHQKILLEEKNKEIIDSITYAKRLQQAILPPLSLISSHLPESFVLYKPKDIVAGDFYWFEHFNDTIFIAAADCTGHGVPGAMVSVVCSNALNRTVKEFGIKEPGEILEKVRDLVIETFEKSESEVKDGMDISLCTIKGTEIKWSGANNPLWYKQGEEFKEIKANKQPIGKTDNAKPFTTHTLLLSKGDILYLFTDGYADQFGGPQGKKFKYKQMLELMKDNSNQAMDKQNQALTEAFTKWKSDLEQVDDVCIIGVRL